MNTNDNCLDVYPVGALSNLEIKNKVVWTKRFGGGLLSTLQRYFDLF